MTGHRRRPSRGQLALLALTGVAVCVASCSSSGPPTPAAGSPSGASTSPSGPAVALSETYPNAIAVLGHSGTTGYNSDPSTPGTDANENSWATGDNPAVNSIYSRLLALNPAIQGHNATLGVDGSTVDDLAPQVDQALALSPVPDLFMIQEVDNDMRCDGTDPDNYEPFAQTLTTELTKIVAAAPKATVLLVSSPPGTVQNYGEVVSELGGAPRLHNTGTGPCDLFNPSGQAVHAHWRYQEKVIAAYQAKLAAVCKQFPTCIYDGGALYRMVITAEDLAPDGGHLSIAGHAKQAALEWKILGLGS